MTDVMRDLMEVTYRNAPGTSTYSDLDLVLVNSYFARITAELERPEWND